MNKYCRHCGTDLVKVEKFYSNEKHMIRLAREVKDNEVKAIRFKEAYDRVYEESTLKDDYLDNLKSSLEQVNRMLKTIEIHQEINWVSDHLKDMFYQAIELSDRSKQ